MVAPMVGSNAPSVCLARSSANAATSNNSVLTRTGRPAWPISCITSLVGSNLVQIRSTVSNQANARCTVASITSRGWSETTWMLTQVSIDTLAKSCFARTPDADTMGLLRGLGQGLGYGLFERLGAVGGAADDVDLGALALDDLRRQAGDVAQRVLQRRAGDGHVGDVAGLNVDADPHVAAPTRALAGERAVLERPLHLLLGRGCRVRLRR